MARIQIEVPEQLPFSTEIELYLRHMNCGGQLDHALLLTVASEARARFFQSPGYRERDVEGVGIIVSDAAVHYRSEAFHGETMRIGMGAADFSHKGCDLLWRMSERASRREVARGKTGIVFFDYSESIISPVPDHFCNQFAG